MYFLYGQQTLKPIIMERVNIIHKKTFTSNFYEFIHSKSNSITEVISALLILLFLYTGANKFLDFEKFIGEMNNQPFPNWMTPYLVWSVPSLEILISLALLFKKTRTIGLWGSFILMSLFTVYTATVLLHVFDRIPCSCGGVIKKLTWKQHLFFNIFFVLLSVAGLRLAKKST